ncbi:unnamed protein product, partial [Ectocarpus sp. 12 AP-2014]
PEVGPPPPAHWGRGQHAGLAPAYRCRGGSGGGRGRGGCGDGGNPRRVEAVLPAGVGRKSGGSCAREPEVPTGRGLGVHRRRPPPPRRPRSPDGGVRHPRHRRPRRHRPFLPGRPRPRLPLGGRGPQPRRRLRRRLELRAMDLRRELRVPPPGAQANRRHE